MLNKLNPYLASQELTPGVRLLGGLLLILNGPAVVFGMNFWVFLAPLPGFFFYLYNFWLVFGEPKRATVMKITRAAILYECLMLGIYLTLPRHGFWSFDRLLILFVLVGTIGICLLLLRILVEEQTEATLTTQNEQAHVQ